MEVVGLVVFLAVVGGVGYYFYRKKNNKVRDAIDNIKDKF